MGVTVRIQGRAVVDSLAAVNKLLALGLDVLPGIAAAKGGKTWVCDSSKASSGTGVSVAQAFNTLAAAIAKAGARDTILMLPGRYTEGSLSIARAQKNLTIIGLGGRGAAFVQPSVAATAGLDVRADDVTLINVGVAGTDVAAAYALRVSGSRFRAYNSKFEGALSQVVVGPGPLAAGVLDAAYGEGADCRFEDCEFAWGTNGLVPTSSQYGACTNLIVIGSLFHNLTGDAVGETDTGAIGASRNIRVVENVFENTEAAVAPTHYIKLSTANSTGIVIGNKFAVATITAAKMAIAAGVLWVKNYAENGLSAARPA